MNKVMEELMSNDGFNKITAELAAMVAETHARHNAKVGLDEDAVIKIVNERLDNSDFSLDQAERITEIVDEKVDEKLDDFDIDDKMDYYMDYGGGESRISDTVENAMHNFDLWDAIHEYDVVTTDKLTEELDSYLGDKLFPLLKTVLEKICPEEVSTWVSNERHDAISDYRKDQEEAQAKEKEKVEGEPVVA